ncbi:hypothetical protein D3C80_1611960 [compost metagenome]
MLADCAHVVPGAQAQARPRVGGNHVHHRMEDLWSVGRAALGDQVVHHIERSARGDDSQDREHPAVTITEPQRRHHHRDHQGQDRPAALAEHCKRAQAGQRRQPQQLHAALLRRLVQQKQRGSTDHIGTQDGV